MKFKILSILDMDHFVQRFLQPLYGIQTLKINGTFSRLKNSSHIMAHFHHPSMKLFTPLSLILLVAIYSVPSNSFAFQYDPEIYEAQIALNKLGYNSGKPDGIWGKLTESALIKFQRDSELRVTVRLDDETKKKLGIVSTAESAIDSKDRWIDRDGHYIAYSSGVVQDTNTGLEWMAGPDKDTNWDEAKRWVENLTVAGGGWRMPTIEELETLYEPGRGSRNMTPLLEISGWYVWSGETKDNFDLEGSLLAQPLKFHYGGSSWIPISYSHPIRAFAVRFHM